MKTHWKEQTKLSVIDNERNRLKINVVTEYQRSSRGKTTTVSISYWLEDGTVVTDIEQGAYLDTLGRTLYSAIG